tara:strand:+ start:2424 stop:3194 length:771 start_codon:yes stop_codon:yes gene_type:complete
MLLPETIHQSMGSVFGEQPPPRETVQFCDFENAHDAFYSLGHSSFTLSKAKPAAETLGDALCETAHYCVFDTETSGLSSRDCVIQMAIGFYDEGGSQLGVYDRLWKLPNGVRISEGSFKVHKISTQRLNDEGCETAAEIEKVMKYIGRMRSREKLIVAHNASFDLRMLAQTAKNWSKHWELVADDVFCTMKSARVHCGLISTKTGRLKAPSNTELYEMLTGETVATEELHNALFDVSLTSASFFQGARRGWWSDGV